MESLKKDFTVTTWVMIPVAIAINIVVGTIVYNLSLPIYLDSIGTILVGALAGPWAGALTGLLSNIIGGVSTNYPQLLAYAGVAAVIGFLSGLVGQAGWLRKWWQVVVAGLVTGVVASIVGSPVTAYLFEGVIGNASTDAIIASFRALGWDILPAVLAQGLIIDPIDKVVTYLLLWAIIVNLPQRFLALFPRAENMKPAMPVTAAPAGKPAVATAASKAGTKPLGSSRAGGAD